jgi:hypothetical protein
LSAYRSAHGADAPPSPTRKKNHGRFYFDQKLIPGETWHPDPGGARRFVAERGLESTADGLAFVNMTLFDVQPQRTDLIKLCANRCEHNGKILEALVELSAHIAIADNSLVCIPGDLARHMHRVAMGRRDHRDLCETIVAAIEYSIGNMNCSGHRGSSLQGVNVLADRESA